VFFCSADIGTNILCCALQNSALKWAWNNPHVYGGRECNFVAGSCKTVPLACRSKDWIKIPTLSSRRLPPVVKQTVRILSSRTDLTQSLSFRTAC